MCQAKVADIATQLGLVALSYPGRLFLFIDFDCHNTKPITAYDSIRKRPSGQHEKANALSQAQINNEDQMNALISFLDGRRKVGYFILVFNLVGSRLLPDASYGVASTLIVNLFTMVVILAFDTLYILTNSGSASDTVYKRRHRCSTLST